MDQSNPVQERMLADTDKLQAPFEFKFNEEVFELELTAYVLYLSCIMAYYGNGSVSIAEMNHILEFSDVLIKKNIPDRELVKKEVILEILDYLKAELEKEESSEDKFQLALYSADFFSKKIHDIIEVTHKKKSKREKSCENMFRRFKHILMIDNKSLSKNEKKLLTKIRRNFGIWSFSDWVMGCAIFTILGPIIVVILYQMTIGLLLAD